MKENQEDWKKQLGTVILEIVGMNEIFQSESSLFIQLLSKLEGLSIQENIDFELLQHITNRITSEVDNVNRVLYDLTPKPTGTIEWE